MFFGTTDSYLDINHLSHGTGPICLTLVGLQYGRLAGRQADKIRVEFEIFKILYMLNYLDCYFF